MFWSQVRRQSYIEAPHAYRKIQVIATIVAGTVQLGVQAWMFTNIE